MRKMKRSMEVKRKTHMGMKMMVIMVMRVIRKRKI
jgi:hypothetical protein